MGGGETADGKIHVEVKETGQDRDSLRDGGRGQRSREWQRDWTQKWPRKASRVSQ